MVCRRMELHELYQRCRTDLVLLELSQASTDDLRSLIGQLVRKWNEELSEDSCTLGKLKAFRKILCREYQLSFGPDQRPVGAPRLNPGCLKGIESLLLAGRRLSAPVGTVRDIAVLRIALYCDPGCVGQHVVDVGHPSTCANDKVERVFRVRMIEGILDAIRLRRILYDAENEQTCEDIARTFLTNAMPWLKIGQGTDWQSFASLFRKLRDVFGPENILLPVWNIVMDKRNDLADTLNALCVTADIYFPSDTENLTETHYALCCTANLWSLIGEGLRSEAQLCRKRALFVMRRATEFVNNMDGDWVADQVGLVPFYSGSVIKSGSLVTGSRDKYLLLMEALEEEQYRLISPVLTHLPVLLKDCQEHGTSGPWICILLEKVLGHGNAMVRREGISRLCEFGPTKLDDLFLEVFVRGLNDTLLYKTEGQSYGEPPGLIEELVHLFAWAMECDQGFGKRLLEAMHRLEPGWARVPLFYLVVVLRRAVSKIRDCPFQIEELILIKSLARKYSSTFPTSLKSVFETELIRTIVNTSGPIHDLEALMEVLSELSVRNDGTWVEFRWNPVTVWLKKVVASSDAVEYVRYTCESYNDRRNIREGDIERFTLAIALLHDAGIITLDKSCPSRETVNEWFSSMNFTYLIDMASCLAELEAQRTREPISGLCRPYIGTIMNLLIKAVRNFRARNAWNYGNRWRYVCALRTFMWTKARLIPEKQETDYLENFRIENRSLLNHIREYGPMRCVCATYVFHFLREKLLNDECYGKILRLVPEMSHDETSNCYRLVAALLRQSVSRNGMAKTEPVQLEELLASLSELLDIGGRDTVAWIGSLLSDIVNKTGVKEETRSAFEAILAACWKSVFRDRHSPEFFTTAKNLAEVAVNYQSITRSSELVDQLLNDCQDTPFMKLHILEKMIEKNIYSMSWPIHQNLLLSCLLYGHAPTKDERIEQELYVYISKNDFFPAGVDSNDERRIRAGGLKGLYQIIVSSVGSVMPLLWLLIDTLNKYAGKRYHSQSDVHRTKHRLMQAILILEPKLDGEERAFLAKTLTRLIILDSDQLSVRLMQEWTLVRIFWQRREMIDILWELFEQAIKERPRCTISAARIAFHLSPVLTKMDYAIASEYLYQCCSDSQFDIRFHSQVAVFERFFFSMTRGRIAVGRSPLSDHTAEKILAGIRRKIAKDFFLYRLRPVEDYSFEVGMGKTLTIMYELPRLSGMDPYEWIEPGLFDIRFKTTAHPLEQRNTGSLLANPELSIYHTAREDETEVGLADVQKKIDSTSYGAEVDPSTSATKKGGITVVASLIERPPNLRGLVRTCEIFQAKELVIGNSGHVQDTEFRNLSVAVDEWIQITEVKPSMLQDFLLGKKEAGWTLVGAERTATSVPLQGATFSEKTVLVLGNEKTGIPANLIPLLDTCVEIPQLGMTRSLNVHVTGAICVWEYAKQHSLP